MKVRLSGLPVGSCFLHGRKRAVKKKVDEGKALTIANGKLRTRAVKGDPDVEVANCPLDYIGEGMGMSAPRSLMELGDGRPRRLRRR